MNLIDLVKLELCRVGYYQFDRYRHGAVDVLKIIAPHKNNDEIFLAVAKNDTSKLHLWIPPHYSPCVSLDSKDHGFFDEIHKYLKYYRRKR